MTTNFSHILSPGQIGSMTVKNRMIVTAMGVNFADEGGFVGERLMAYHEKQAEGGVGLIVLGVTGVGWPSGGNLPRQIAISDDKFIPGLKALADRVHKHGAKVAAQLHHGGLVSVQDTAEGRPLWIPSYPTMKQGNFTESFLEEELARNPAFGAGAPAPQLHIVSHDDIKQVVEWFAAGAERAKKAGLDGVEIHAGHGYIISEFISPLTNNRDDEYGGSLENRTRILREIIAAIRDRVGNDFPLWVKLDSGEFGLEEGISLTDAKATARIVEQAGADAITVTSYHDTSKGWLHSESNIPHPPERMIPNAIAMKSAVSIPVIASGRVEPKSADKHIGQGHFDFLGMGRKLLADPGLPNKLLAGKPEQIRPCIYCYCCVSQIYTLDSTKCAVNPETGREFDRKLIASDHSKHIAVVGGGPGGLEAARRLILRGHRVTLIEKSARLGGTLQFASIAYEPNEQLLNWLRLQIKQSPVEVLLNTTATSDMLKRLDVDEVVVASGAIRNMPDIPGNDQDFVFSGDEMRALVLAEDHPELARKTSSFTRLMTKAGALTGISKNPSLVRLASKFWLPLGKRITIIGAELVGLELAEFLAERNHQVTVVDSAKKPGKGLFVVRRARLLDELNDLGVNLLNLATDISIGDHNVSYTNYRGQQRCLDTDTVIVAQGATGDTSVAEQFQRDGLTVHTIGDCNGVSYIEGAIESAAELALTI